MSTPKCSTHFNYSNHIAFISTHTKISAPHKNAPLPRNPAHQCKALGTNESVRGLCYFLDMAYQEALLKCWFYPVSIACFTIGDRHWRKLAASFEKPNPFRRVPDSRIVKWFVIQVTLTCLLWFT